MMEFLNFKLELSGLKIAGNKIKAEYSEANLFEWNTTFKKF